MGFSCRSIQWFKKRIDAGATRIVRISMCSIFDIAASVARYLYGINGGQRVGGKAPQKMTQTQTVAFNGCYLR